MERRELLKSYDEIKVIISQSSELFGFIQHVVAVVRICHYQMYITISLMLILQDVFHFHQKIHYYDDDNVWVKIWGDDNVTRVWDFFIFRPFFDPFLLEFTSSFRLWRSLEWIGWFSDDWKYYSHSKFYSPYNECHGHFPTDIPNHHLSFTHKFIE